MNNLLLLRRHEYVDVRYLFDYNSWGLSSALFKFIFGHLMSP